jgi:REP element-mobilizing transposase RayT
VFGGAGPPTYQPQKGCPTFRDFRKVGTTALADVHSSQTHSLSLCYESPMPNRLHRYYGAGYLHFITTSCYQRRPLLDSRLNRDLFLQVLEQVRRRYRFVVVGYVVMPEHVHLLLSEPERGNPSLVMQAVKQGYARRILGKPRCGADSRHAKLTGNVASAENRIWQPRFYDFVVFTEKSVWKNCATCTATRSNVDSYPNRGYGRGAVSVTMRKADMDLCW